MGYDMHFENPPKEMDAALKEHNDYWTHYSENKGKPVPPDPTYFRLNIFGMATYREFMQQFGMLATHYPRPSFKNNDPTEAPLAGEEPGIPVDKLGSNDNWLVRPEEITSALLSYDKLDRKAVVTVVGDHLDYWDKWIAFLRQAATCGGFRVN